MSSPRSEIEFLREEGGRKLFTRSRGAAETAEESLLFSASSASLGEPSPSTNLPQMVLEMINVVVHKVAECRGLRLRHRSPRNLMQVVTCSRYTADGRRRRI